VCLVIYVVVQIAGTVVTVLTWEQGKPVMSGEFFVRLLVMPLLLTGVLCAMHFISYEQSLEETDWWNYLCRKARAQWRVWAREHMAILGSVTLTPEADLGERLLGLEGATPGNPDRVMPLPHSENASESDSRLEQVLERLLTPLVASISRFASTRSFEVLLQSSRQEHLVELQQVWRRLGLSDLVRLSWASLDAAPSMLEQWFASERAPDFRLVLACQLHRRRKGAGVVGSRRRTATHFTGCSRGFKGQAEATGATVPPHSSHMRFGSGCAINPAARGADGQRKDQAFLVQPPVET
jgi:hypothetical protein